jgi:hypothetical protein
MHLEYVGVSRPRYLRKETLLRFHQSGASETSNNLRKYIQSKGIGHGHQQILGTTSCKLGTLFLKVFDNEGLRINELIGMLKKGQLPNLRTIQFATFYDSDEFGNWETMKDDGCSHDIEQLWEYGIGLSVDRCYDPSPMPENGDWPCDCWTYHHKAKSLVLLRS